MQILSAESVAVQIIFCRDSITVLLYAAGLVGDRIEHLTTRTCPSEGTDAEALDRHHPDTTDDILAVIIVLRIHTFTIVNTNLIVEHTTTIGVGEEITLELDTDITTTRRALTSTVTESREFVDHVSITTPALCDGVRGVLKGERTLELTSADLELWESSPFCIEVNELNGGLTRTSGVGTLNLGAPVEVTDLTVEDETGQISCWVFCTSCSSAEIVLVKPIISAINNNVLFNIILLVLGVMGTKIRKKSEISKFYPYYFRFFA